MEIRTVTLKDFTSLRIGGDVHMVDVTSVEELKQVIQHAKSEEQRVHILGAGTNTFFADDLPGVLVVKICIRGITEHRQQITTDTVYITSGAGEVWDDVVIYSVSHGYWGLENLSYIPGTVGASPVQNIGAYGVELADIFVSLTALDMTTMQVMTFDKEMCHFRYRDSIFKQQKGTYVILSVTLKVSTQPHPVLTYKPLDGLAYDTSVTVQTIRDLVVQTRMSKLPDYNLYPNAGSFFKNPIITSKQAIQLQVTHHRVPLHETKGGYKVPAAWLIEHVAEMKGLRTENAGTWPAQPLVLVNYGGTSAQELMHFSQNIIDAIYVKTGIELEREVNIVV